MIHSRRDFLRALEGLGTGAAAARTPDLEVKVRLDVLEEIDFLAERYALFRRAS